MRSGQCPKCGSIDVYSKKDGFSGGFSIRVKQFEQVYARTEDYVCLSCGHFEQYIVNLNDISDLRNQWEKRSPR